jgi:hypothetical protein
MEKINYLQVIPRCSPKVAEELLNLLGAPEVEVIFRSQISDNEIKKNCGIERNNKSNSKRS